MQKTTMSLGPHPLGQRSKLKEASRHGRTEFPFACYTGYTDQTQKVTHHWHQEMELIWMPAPGGTVFINGKAHTTKESSVFFVHPGEIHAWDSRGKASARTVAIVFHWRLLDMVGGAIRERTLQPIAMGKLRFPTQIQAKKGWRQQLCEDVVALGQLGVEQKSGYELLVISKLFSLLAKLSAANAFEDAAPVSFQRQEQRLDHVKRAMNFMTENYAEKITLEQLAREARLSPFHFARTFKAMTHLTPVNYLNRLRVERATDLLKEKERKILDVALDVGFSHLSYFNKTFRRFQGCTPSEYRAGVF